MRVRVHVRVRAGRGELRAYVWIARMDHLERGLLDAVLQVSMMWRAILSCWHQRDMNEEVQKWTCRNENAPECFAYGAALVLLFYLSLSPCMCVCVAA